MGNVRDLRSYPAHLLLVRGYSSIHAQGKKGVCVVSFSSPSISWENRALVECHNNGLDDQDGYFSKNNNIPCVCLLLLQLKSNISTVDVDGNKC